MASVNKVIIIGNLGRDPEIRYTPNGNAVCNVGIATTRSWKNKETGEKTEETEWHRVVFYDRLAEIAGEYLKRGRSVYVEGRLKTREWQDKDGHKRQTTEIVAEEMKMLGDGQRRGDDQQGQQSTDRVLPGTPGSNSYSQAKQGNTGGAAALPAAKSNTGFDQMDDDIPFIVSTAEYDIAPPKARRMARYDFT